MSIILILFAASFLGFFLHLALSKEERTLGEKAELFLLYQIVFNVGLISFLSFYGFIFLPELVAEKLGWPTCPFQHEMGNVNLAFGVLGILAIWLRGNFWTAIVIGVSIWLLGDAVGHVVDMVQNNNYAEGNVGIPLYTDIAIPVVLLIAFYFWKKYQPGTNQ
ncbi:MULTISPECIES: DUF6790 family protein [Parachlamydia]|jgi:hypothetical protein|uniref:Uncharacterized protein n=1 Tax=Parachlamydia acanthamoebae (strain UV7) TaxID=765952 RepID=F8KZN2_PARAV|nr:DUF6790 family protein [Parachlamydia acanthamoebae]EFB41739.1 hypothetical protein pah_c022o004 [Parachlamydia acanthamoebae str. Hall's coccus]CCB86378.1 putative uncharacterized protein [Parachlamydia acanthamoebae UV-7]